MYVSWLELPLKKSMRGTCTASGIDWSEINAAHNVPVQPYTEAECQPHAASIGNSLEHCLLDMVVL